VRDAAVALQSVDELLLPSEPTPDNSGHRAVGSPFIYGMRRWRDLYTPRQLLCLTTYVTLVRELPAHTVEQRAVRILLALAMSKMADYASSLVPGESNVVAFAGRSAGRRLASRGTSAK